MNATTKYELRQITNEIIDESMEDVFIQLKKAAHNGESKLVININVLSEIQFGRLVELGFIMRNNSLLDESTIEW